MARMQDTDSAVSMDYYKNRRALESAVNLFCGTFVLLFVMVVFPMIQKHVSAKYHRDHYDYITIENEGGSSIVMPRALYNEWYEVEVEE